MTLFSLVSKHDMGSIRVIWQYKDEIKRHRLFFEDGLDVYEQTAIVKSFERIQDDIDFFTGFSEYRDEEKNDLNPIIQLIKEYQSKYGDVAINVSEASGTSCALLGLRLLPLGIKFISYNPAEHEITITDNNSTHTMPAARDLGITKLFNIRGFHTELEFSRQYLEQNATSLQTLLSRPKKYQAAIETLNSQGSMSYNDLYYNEFLNIGAIDNLGTRVASLKRLIGGIFEEYVGSIVSEMPFDDVVCGLKVYWGGVGKNISNEFDILASYKNQLFVIECKMRSKIDEEELLYKYDALRRYIAPQTRAAIVHLASKKHTEVISNKIKERYALNGIGLYSVKKVEIDDFKNFITKAFLEPHPSDMAWADAQAASCEALVIIKDNCDEQEEPKLKNAPKPQVQVPLKLPETIKLLQPNEKLKIVQIAYNVNPPTYFHIAATNLFRFLLGWSKSSMAYASFKEKVWRDILNNAVEDGLLKQYISNIKDVQNYEALKSLVVRFINIPLQDRLKTNEELLDLVATMDNLYNNVRLEYAAKS